VEQGEVRSICKDGTAAILNGFLEYQENFGKITRRARSRFEQCDWHGSQSDARQRLDLYAAVVYRVVEQVRTILEEALKDKAVWACMNSLYAQEVHGRSDVDLAETFFNSITRRIFATVGVDPNIEFAELDFDRSVPTESVPVYRPFYRTGSLQDLLREVIGSFPFDTPYQDLDRDLELAAQEIEDHLRQAQEPYRLRVVEFLQPVFYRGKGAYLIGRARLGARYMPLVLSLRNRDGRIVIDAVLYAESEVSIIFSFTRSYFHVEVDQPRQLVSFLKTIMPRKPVAEIFIALGYNKHGKTELYRDLLRHLERSHDHFASARGEKGMVMLVFTLPSYDMVFKMIRDRFLDPKTSTRQEVMDRYHLVFTHDRAGRLVDAQEFEHLRFEKSRFSDDLLQELLSSASESVTIEEDYLSIRHLYTERRLVPLDIYLREAPAEAALEAVLDYGQAIKDLAATNIFPGDILTKNFGVTRHGRVVFYDYDELALLTQCRFRSVPAARSHGDEYSSEPWFYVGDKDIFPEEFRAFLGFQGELREAFEQAHGDLFTAAYWRKMQALLNSGEVVDIDPYPPRRKLGAASISQDQPG
jgi:isocitrate dehydrogenase kinase/phosphatase